MNKIRSRFIKFLYLSIPVLLFSCNPGTDNETAEETNIETAEVSSAAYDYADIEYAISPPAWSENATIYEVNVRQYTQEGTFNAMLGHLSRLKEMGIDILWLMPIHPIGEEKRKGSVGSYYSVKDYVGLDPAYGSLDDFKNFVDSTHSLGMYVIIDWVANHSAWDNPMTVEHPEWYTKDSLGNFVPPVADWSDVIDLNYEDKGLWEYMINALKYWVEEVDIDGYRCDVAGMVPVEFWNQARAELDKVKPVFMLAEAEGPELHDKAFDMSYAWEFHFILNEVAEGKKTINDIDEYFDRETKSYSKAAYRMQFTSNHDENSWKGTVFERMGEGATFAVLTATVPGMPLVYSGQEAALDKRLEFFEKDLIDWDNYSMETFYTKLLHLKRNNQALWNGRQGGDFIRLNNSAPDAVYSYLRANDNNKVLVLLNLNATAQKVTLQGESYSGEYTDLFKEENVVLKENQTFDLEPWAYKVYFKK